MAIKMRVNNDKESSCEECKVLYKNTPEMYDMVLAGQKFTLCKECIETLLNKTLKASCMYNGKVKSQEDLRRAERARVRKSRGSVL